MKTTSALAVALAAVAVSASPSPVEIDALATPVKARAASLPTITTKGNAFYSGNDRFYIKGIDYQPGGSSGTTGADGASDPLADPTVCKRDIPYFQKLGLNTIRVYTVDNSKNHDECMAALADAGIYLVLDVNTPLYSLDRNDPAGSYNPYYLQSVFATIDQFAGYSNTLLFFSGNEVINTPKSTSCAPYVKAVTRDMKQYIGERGYRSIPVGYSAADVSQNQYEMAQYMDCGSEPSRSDFYAINNYEWCDPSSYQTSGWDIIAQQYANYSLPVFMSEYGCITNKRTFQEVPALYGSTMTGSFSGGLIYEYSEEGNGYGVVNINGNTVTPIADQFNALMQEMSQVNPPSGSGGASTQNSPQQCPGQSANWDTKPFTGSALPATPSGAMKYFQNGAGTGPGLSGKGSQWESGGSSATASASAGAVTATYGSGATGSSGSSSGSSSSSAGTVVRAPEFAHLVVCGFTVVIGVVLGASIL